MKRVPLSGFIKAVKAFDNSEVAAIIEDLDLVPEFLITPDLIGRYRRELAAKAEGENAVNENVRLALAYTSELLNSEYGRFLIAKYRERFSYDLPLNR